MGHTSAGGLLARNTAAAHHLGGVRHSKAGQCAPPPGQPFPTRPEYIAPHTRPWGLSSVCMAYLWTKPEGGLCTPSNPHHPALSGAYIALSDRCGGNTLLGNLLHHYGRHASRGACPGILRAYELGDRLWSRHTTGMSRQCQTKT